MPVQRKLRLCSVIALLLMAFIMPIAVNPPNVSADEYRYSCLYANATAAEVSIRKSHYGGTFGAMEVAVFAEGDIYDIYAPADEYYYTFKTSGFTGGGFTGWMPPEDANITAVILQAYGPMMFPPATFSYALEGEDAYNTSAVIEDRQYTVAWEITYLENWTSDIFEGDFWIKLLLQPDGLTHYYLDYVGLLVYYTTEEEYEGGEDEDPVTYDGSEIDYGLIYGEGIVGTLGFFGLIGMVGVPALAVYIYRHQNVSIIGLFVNSLAMFMIFLTMFLYSITVS